MMSADRAGQVMAALVADCAGGLSLGHRPLVAGDASGHLVAAVMAAVRLRGEICEAATWLRFAGGCVAAEPWPPPGPFTSALVRLPKGKPSLDFALAAAAAVTPPGAPLVLFGTNDEGIRSAALRLAGVAEDVETLATRAHARVLAGRRREMIADLHTSLAAWRQPTTNLIAGTTQPWITYPGLFAGGRLDDGTALLLQALADIARPQAGARVLDYACGPGAIAAHMRAIWPEAVVDGLDADALALLAAEENVPGARLLLGTRLAATGGVRYDLIVSNPPIHDGIAEDHGTLAALIADAPRHLAPGGTLVLVVQRRVAIEPALRAAFGRIDVLRRTARFVVLRAGGGGADKGRRGSGKR